MSDPLVLLVCYGCFLYSLCNRSCTFFYIFNFLSELSNVLFNFWHFDFTNILIILFFTSLISYRSFPVSCFVIITMFLMIFDISCCCFSNSSIKAALISSMKLFLSKVVFLFVSFWSFFLTEVEFWFNLLKSETWNLNSNSKRCLSSDSKFTFYLHISNSFWLVPISASNHKWKLQWYISKVWWSAKAEKNLIHDLHKRKGFHHIIGTCKRSLAFL